MNEQVVLLFSGGLDSTLASASLAMDGYEVILLSFDNGALRDRNKATDRYEILRRKYPEQVIRHESMESIELFRQIALADIESDFKKYRYNMICLGCKLSMHAYAAVYAKRNGISTVADGSSSRQSMWPEQSRESVDFFKGLYNRYDLSYITPVYGLESKDRVKQELKKLGLPDISSEARCLFGSTFSSPDTQEYKRVTRQYLKDKVRWVYSFIDGGCRV